MSKRIFVTVLFCLTITTFLFPQTVQRVKKSTPKILDTLYNDSSREIARAVTELDLTDQLRQTDQEQKMKFSPGEIIMEYNVSSFKRLTGNEILAEYEELKDIVEIISGKQIKECNPVYSFIVNRMVADNITEIQAKDLIIKKAGIQMQKIAAINNTLLNTQLSRTVVLKFEDSEIDLLELSKIIMSDGSIKQSGFNIAYAEPNYLYYADYFVNDPMFTSQWAHSKTQAAAGWDIQRGSSNIKIGIIDTGIDYLHEDLVQNYVSSLSYDFVDIDTNAYKQDNYNPIAGEDYTSLDTDPKDFNGHGTHVAGIIGASANNSRGISGVMHNCSIISLRAGFSIKSGSSEVGALENDDISNAIWYAIANGIDILNMSFGGPSAQTINNAISAASSNNIILIAAAGNSSTDQYSYPAAYENVISVASTSYSDTRSYFSNYGNWIDVAAPGESIISTMIRSGGSSAIASGYRYMNGTSMAAPYVAGLAGLLLSKNEGLTPKQIEYIICKSSDLPQETANYIGMGRVNILKALQLNTIKTFDLYAGIFSPSSGTPVTGTVDFVGTANGANYILEYGSGLYPRNWVEISHGSYVSNSSLGALNSTEIPDGRYTVRLLTWDNEKEKEARISLIVDNTTVIHPGFPIVLTPRFYSIIESFTLYDLDGNGTKEIIVLSGTKNNNVHPFTSALYVYNSEGQILPGWPVDLPMEGLAKSYPLAADMNNDGKGDIVIMGIGSDDSDWGANMRFICIFNLDGSIQPGWPVKARALTNEFSISDINLDGKLEIVIGGSEEMFVFKNDGSFLNGWPAELPVDYFNRSPMVLSNLDSDPEIEISSTVFNSPDPNSNPHYTYAFNHDGTIVPGFPFVQDFWGWTLAGGDINNDGKIEILTQEGPLSSSGNKMPWAHNQIHSYSQFAIGNVNQDPFLEVVYGDGDARAYLTDYLGRSLPGWPKREKEYSADNDNLIADIAGDERPEIIIPWAANTAGSLNQKPGLYAYNIDGSTVTGFPKLEGINTIDKVAVDDIDGDGLTEIICMDYDALKIMVFDLQKSFSARNVEWPIYQNNSWSTGAYPVYGDKMLTNFQSFSINEDDTLTIQISPTHVNWNKFQVTPSSSVNGVMPVFQNGVLKVATQPNWNGDSRVITSVLDQQLIDSSSFNIHIIPLNDAPLLSLPLPDVSCNEDSTSIIIQDIHEFFNEVDINDHLTFSARILDPGLDSVIIGNLEFAGAEKFKKGLNANKKTMPPLEPGSNTISANSVSTVSLFAYPSKDFYGKLKIAITAVDDSLESVTDTLELTVIPVNDKPVISAIPDQRISEDDSLIVNLISEDRDNDTLTYSVFCAVEKVSLYINKNKLVVKPNSNWFGSSIVSVVVSDNSDRDTASFSVDVIPINDPPALLHSFDDVIISEDDFSAVIIPNLSYNFTDFDPDDALVFAASSSGSLLDSLTIGPLPYQDSSLSNKKVYSLKRTAVKNGFAKHKGAPAAEDLNGAKKLFSAGSVTEQLCLVAYPKENVNGTVQILVKAIDDSSAETVDTLNLLIQPVNDQPVLSSINDQVISEDDSVLVILQAYDADNDTLIYSIESAPTKIESFIQKDTVKIKPFKNWNGSAVISIIASDSFDSDTTLFNLTVLPVNDKPDLFSLIAPAQFEQLLFTDSSQANTITFSWTKSADVDDDSIQYSLFITDSINNFTVQGIKDTVYSLPYSQFQSWLNNGKAEIEWDVLSSDSLDSTYSGNGSYSLIILNKITGVNELELPKEFALFQNYPNPFNPSTMIKFEVPVQTLVTIRIFDILGTEITTLVNKEYSAGSYTVEFLGDGKNQLASGIYLCVLKARDFTKTMKMVMLK